MTVFDELQQQFWQEHGYMVVRDAVPAPLLEAVKLNIEEFLGKDLSDPNDWYREPMYPGGIVNMNAHQPMWETRQYPRVHEAFSQILGTEKLRVSVDRTNMNPPAGPQWDHKGTIHWDMDSTERPVPLKVQGVPEGLVELWLRRQRDADMVRVEADRVACYDLIPSLIRVEKDGRAQYLNPAWGRILDGKTLEAQRAHGERLELPFTGPAEGSTKQIREAMGQLRRVLHRV